MTSTDYSFLSFASESDVEEYIHSLVDFTLQQVNHEIDQKYISTVDVPLAAEIAMKKLFSLVNLAMYPHDGAVVPSSPQLVLEDFKSEKELKLCPVDNWARGAGDDPLTFPISPKPHFF
jgi:hypothetical protein